MYYFAHLIHTLMLFVKSLKSEIFWLILSKNTFYKSCERAIAARIFVAPNNGNKLSNLIARQLTLKYNLPQYFHNKNRTH